MMHWPNSGPTKKPRVGKPKPTLYLNEIHIYPRVIQPDLQILHRRVILGLHGLTWIEAGNHIFFSRLAFEMYKLVCSSYVV